MRRYSLATLVALGSLVIVAPAASAQNLKFTFSDVTLPDGQIGESKLE